MATRQKSVILCRGLSEKNDTQEEYVKTLRASGYQCDCLRTLRFEFLNVPKLRACLLSPHMYLGLILTSKRAVEAVGLASEDDKGILHPWKYLPIYCVGPATDSFAKTHLGFERCFGSDSGNAKELAERIINKVEKDSNKSLLYPCSEIARETIEQSLSDNGINVEKIVSYKTLASETLEQDLVKLMDNTEKIFVFFSPSTVDHIGTLFKNKSFDTNSIKAVAIGPVTKQALINAGFNIYATASKPEPEALLKAISEAVENEIIK